MAYKIGRLTRANTVSTQDKGYLCFVAGLDVHRPNLLLGVMVVNKPKTDKKSDGSAASVNPAVDAKSATATTTQGKPDAKKEKSGM